MIYLISYLLGSLLFSPLLARLFRINDLSKNGSGNLGATNLARVSGKKGLGVLAALLDGGKAALATFLTNNLEGQIICGSFAILGHLFPFWSWRGGKGIASFLGLAFALNPVLGFLLLIVWAITFSFFRISSLSSLMMLMTSIILYPFFIPLGLLWSLIPILILIFFKHKENIIKLLSGKEKRL
jgi:glycerol-3-phosphate acyltransferase PlsY